MDSAGGNEERDYYDKLADEMFEDRFGKTVDDTAQNLIRTNPKSKYGDITETDADAGYRADPMNIDTTKD